MEEKSRRSQPHFSNQERAALLLIVKKYEKYIEENGNNKKVSRFNKNRAWLVIKQEFNRSIGSIGNERDVLSLRSKYIDMRKKHVQATKHKREFESDSRRNILQELIDEVHNEEINDELISIKNEPVEELLDEEDYSSEYNHFNEEQHTDDSDANKRGANYTNYEKFLLMKLVDKYRGCLINSGSDSKIRSEKTNTWDSICKEFRELCPDGQYRTAQKLRDKFSDMKKVHRKTIKYSVNRDKEFYLMKKLLENNFDEEILPELPSSALSKVLSETPVCIESLPDIRDDDEEEDEDDVNYSVESILNNEEHSQNNEEQSHNNQGHSQINEEHSEINEGHSQFVEGAPSKTIKVHPKTNEEPFQKSAQEQYYIDKNRREEEEHKMTMEILKLRAQKETLDIKFRTEEHEMRKDVLCREMEKND